MIGTPSLSAITPGATLAGAEGLKQNVTVHKKPKLKGIKALAMIPIAKIKIKKLKLKGSKLI